MPKFNYTRRRKLEKTDIEIKLIGESELFFTAHMVLDRYEFPPDAIVIVEAYRQATYMRFEFGSVVNIVQPADTSLHEFDSPDAILFRVKVIENSCHKKILGLTKEIRPHQEGDSNQSRISILPLKPDFLKHKIWDIDFAPEGPILLINEKLNNPKYITRNPIFRSLVFPEIIKAVFTKILILEKDTESDWCKNWIEFALALPGTLPIPNIADDPNSQAVEDWITDVASAFARSMNTLELFKKNWRD